MLYIRKCSLYQPIGDLKMSISKYDDVIDSRDIIERIQELETLLTDESTNAQFLNWCEEYDMLVTLAEECAQYNSDWEYGVSLVRYSYFEDYMDEMIEDCYELPKDLPFWMSIEFDYEALKQDYAEVEFDGITYYILSC